MQRERASVPRVGCFGCFSSAKERKRREKRSEISARDLGKPLGNLKLKIPS
jgi:hypothetical protein